MRGKLIQCPSCGASVKVPEKSQIAHRPPVSARKIVLSLLIIGSVVVATLFALHFRKQREVERFTEARAERKAAAAAAVPPRPPSWESNALYMAARGGDLETMKKILDAQPERINEVSGGMRATMLNIAAYKGNKDVVEELLRRKAKVNVQTKGGHTPLYDCVLGEGGTVEIARMLLDAGADATIADNAGKTPLQIAAENGKQDIADLLRQSGVKK